MQRFANTLCYIVAAAVIVQFGLRFNPVVSGIDLATFAFALYIAWGFTNILSGFHAQPDGDEYKKDLHSTWVTTVAVFGTLLFVVYRRVFGGTRDSVVTDLPDNFWVLVVLAGVCVFLVGYVLRHKLARYKEYIRQQQIAAAAVPLTVGPITGGTPAGAAAATRPTVTAATSGNWTWLFALLLLAAVAVWAALHPDETKDFLKSIRLSEIRTKTDGPRTAATPTRTQYATGWEGWRNPCGWSSSRC